MKEHNKRATRKERIIRNKSRLKQSVPTTRGNKRRTPLSDEDEDTVSPRSFLLNEAVAAPGKRSRKITGKGKAIAKSKPKSTDKTIHLTSTSSSSSDEDLPKKTPPITNSYPENSAELQRKFAQDLHDARVAAKKAHSKHSVKRKLKY